MILQECVSSYSKQLQEYFNTSVCLFLGLKLIVLIWALKWLIPHFKVITFYKLLFYYFRYMLKQDVANKIQVLF